MEDNLKIIASEIGELLEKKNRAYGNSVNMTYEIFGMEAYLVRLYDKLNRLTNLTKNGGPVNDESIEDTLRDLAGYSILAINQLQMAKQMEKAMITEYYDGPTRNETKNKYKWSGIELALASKEVNAQPYIPYDDRPGEF